MTFIKHFFWGSFDLKSVCKINSLTGFTQPVSLARVFEGTLLLDHNLQGSSSFSRMRAANQQKESKTAQQGGSAQLKDEVKFA